jgi:hypothetical protein
MRQRRRDLQSLLDAGLESPRGAQLLSVMIANENVLALSIHRNQPVTAEIGGTTSDVLVIYELMFGAEALSRVNDPYPDELIRDQLGLDLAQLEGAISAQTVESRRSRRRTTFRRESAYETEGRRSGVL